jgi:hypothetical protein
MTEFQWLWCRKPQKMLRFVRDRGKASERKLRLLAWACCRRVWDLLPNEESRQAIEVAELFADGSANEDELTTVVHHAQRPAKDAAAKHMGKFPGAAGRAAAALRGRHAYTRLYEAYGQSLRRGAPQKVARELGLSAEAARDPRDAYLEAEAQEAAAQPALLRDLFGPLPFREVPIAPSILAWNDGCIVRLAQAAYEERSLPGGTLDQARLAVLADALEEAGCADAELLAHLRSPGPHIRGCFAVDAVLVKS